MAGDHRIVMDLDAQQGAGKHTPATAATNPTSPASSTGPTSTAGLAGLVDPKSPEKLAALGGVAGLAAALGTDLSIGLATGGGAVEASQERYGANVLPPVEFKSFLQLVWETLQDRTLIMLLVAAGISLAVGMSTKGVDEGWVDGTAVVVAVSLVVFITSLNDYQKERQFRALNDRKNDRLVSVVRDGRSQRVSIYALVVGDVVLLEAGDVVPTDGVYVRGRQLQCDESAATGESDTIRKGEAADGRDPFFLSGAQVVEGGGAMLAIAVGEHSYNGRLLLALRTPTPDTPLQRKLSVLANIIGNFGLIAAIVIFLAQVVKYFAIEGAGVDSSDALNEVAEFLVIAITIVVVAVPEGLPLAVTISLAFSLMSMVKDNILVRRLEACETMGGATTICSDKTGTLTQNKMAVVQGNLLGARFADAAAFDPASLDPAGLALFVEAVAVNSSAYEEEGGAFVGSKTECALLAFAKGLGADPMAARAAATVTEVFPFSSTRKRMATVVANATGGHTLHAKGASEVVLAMCSRLRLADGTVAPMEAATRTALEQEIRAMAEQALRTLTLAYRETEAAQDWTDAADPGLVLLAVVGIQDPLRPEVAEAVRHCQEAGVVVRMVTGDNINTARAIAKSCGIVRGPEDVVMEGIVFRGLDPQARIKVAPRLRVMARSSPTDKQELVDTLQMVGEVVAVTGDGVNDGPALKRADVGFSMGIAGTQVAKEASDIVLLDDNFASIVNAIKWGRNVFDSVRKFLQFQLVVNFSAIALVFVVIMADSEGSADAAPLKPVQLLWINLIMDTFAAVALATEPAHEELLTYRPYDRHELLITTFVGRRMVFQVAMQTVTFLLLIYLGEGVFGSERTAEDRADDDVGRFSVEHLTVVFNTFVLTQLLHQFCARQIRRKTPFNPFARLSRHRIFVGVWLFAFAVQILIVTFGGGFVKTAPLTLVQWLGCLAVASLTFLWALLYNLLPLSLSAGPWPWWDALKARFLCSCFRGGQQFETADGEGEGEGEGGVEGEGEGEGEDKGKGGDTAPAEAPLPVVNSPDTSRRAASHWDSAISKVITQVGVVEVFRRHHR